eukprot:356004_1
MSQKTFTNLFLVLVAYIVTCHCVTQSILLTPDDPSFITLLKGATNYAPFEWDLYAVDEMDFNMKIHLNTSWAFHDQYPTKLTLEIGSDTPTTAPNSSLIVSFSQNHSKYFTSVIQIGGTDDHLVYPPPNSAKQSYGQGDIEASVSQPHGTRTDKATNNGSYGYFEPFTSHPNLSYPLQFVIENHPDFDYMIFSYSNPQVTPRNVVYFAMDPNQPLDIYLSAGAQGDNFDITYLNIAHTVSLQTVETDTKETIASDYDHTQTTEISTESPIAITKKQSWFEHALVIILIATVAILCCLFCAFGAMFTIILRNNKNAIHETTKQKQQPALNIVHPVQMHQGSRSAVKSSTSATTPTVTLACSPPSNATVLTMPSNGTPTLTDILAALAPKSASNFSFRGAEQKRLSSVGTTPQRDEVYDLAMRYNQRSRGNTMNSGGEIEEMDEPDNISEENEQDLEAEALYFPPSKADIRRAT